MNNISSYPQLERGFNPGYTRPVSTLRDRPGFEIHLLRGEETQFPTQNVYEKTDRIELVWVRTGSGFVQLKGETIELLERSIFCVLPGQIRRYNFDSSFEGDYICFSLEFIRVSEGYSTASAWIERYTTPISRIAIDDDMQYDLESIMNKMKWESGNCFNRRQEIIKGLLNIFLIYLSRTYKDANTIVEQTREFELVSRFTTLVKRNFKLKKMVTDYANDLCVSPNYLNRTIKKLTGYPASYHINQQIISEAKRKRCIAPLA